MAYTQFVNSVNLNARSSFPYMVLDVHAERSEPLNPRFQVMHWHDDLQFLLVLEGTVQIRTLGGFVELSQGQAVFINTAVAHMVVTTAGSRHNSFLFPSSFLGFGAGLPSMRYVDRLVGEPSLPLIAFDGTQPWHVQVIDLLYELSSMELARRSADGANGPGALLPSDDPDYAFEVLLRLNELWLILARNVRLGSVSHTGAGVASRMRTFLDYIARHYGESVTLTQLAASATVSVSECLRCFHSSLDTTPYRYLMRFRLYQARNLLEDTDLPIADIARRVGYRDPSNFSRLFALHVGLSPRTYRRNRRKSEAEQSW